MSGTSIPFFRKYKVPAGKRVSADLLEFAASAIAQVVNGRKKVKIPQRVWEDKLQEKSWVVEARKRLQVESFQQNLQKMLVGREEILSQTFVIIHVEQISLPSFWRSFWKFCRFSPSSWQSVVVQEPKIYPTTSLDENCIEFESQRDRNCYFNLRQTYLVLKLKFVKGHGYETYKTKKLKKSPKKKQIGWRSDGGGETWGCSSSLYSSE